MNPLSFVSPAADAAAYTPRSTAQAKHTDGEGATWSPRLHQAEPSLASPRLLERQAQQPNDQKHASYSAYILRTTQQMSFKPIAQEEGTAARFLGIEGMNFHRKRDDLTDFTEALARERGMQRLIAGMKPA